MRIILADELILVRCAIKALLQSMAALSVEVVGETGDGKELIDLCLSLKPDIVVTEVPLQSMNGIEVNHQLRKHLPSMAVLFLSAKNDSYTVRQAMQNGAAGYCVMDADPVELLPTLRALAEGLKYLSPKVPASGLEPRNRERGTTEGVLSNRQRQVLRLMGRGKSTKEIASLLGLSVKTVETHRARTAQVLGLYGTNALMRFAIKSGMDNGDLH